MVYSGMTVSYYNKIAKERMKNGPAFCIEHSNITPDKIDQSLMISID